MKHILASDLNSYLAADLHAGKITLLLGSAISIDAPANLPAGQQVTDLLAELLAGPDIGKTAPAVESQLKDTAFEHLMEACPERAQLRRLLASRYNRAAPNENHLAIAALLGANRIRHVITTNYDLCLDAAFSGLPVDRVVLEGDVAKRTGGRPTYFKIHGCASDPQSMVFTLSAEHALEPWKKALLTELIGTSLLVAIGYSGYDFEICPELLVLKPRIAWVTRKQPSSTQPYQPSPGGSRVLELPQSTAVVGTMDVVLDQMMDGVATIAALARSVMTMAPAVVPILAQPSSAFTKTDFQFGSTPAERCWNLNAWRCQLFRGVGCANAAARAADNLLRAATNSVQRAQALHARGLAAFHAGRYRAAADLYGQAAGLSSGSDRLGYLFDQVEGLRCFGREGDAEQLLIALERQAPAYRAQIFVRRLALLASRFERERDNQRRAAIQADAVPIARELVACSHTPGTRFEHQQCALLVSRLDIAGQVDTAPYAPPPARSGYHQIGYFVAEAMAVRQELLSRSAGTDLAQAREILGKLDHFGAAAEAWKFGLALARKTHGRARWLGLLAALKNYMKCQYSLKHRWDVVERILRSR